MIVQTLMDNLDLPEYRAERVMELVNKREQEGLSTSEFIELAANLFVRREMLANDAVTVPGVKTFFGLDHLANQGEPSINDLLRAEFEDFSSDEIKEVYEQAQDDAPVHLTSNIVLFHEADIDLSDGFDIDMETASGEEATTTDDEDDGTATVDVDAAL